MPLSYLALHNEFHATFLKAIVRQYVATLLWSENDDDDIPLDSGDNADLPLSNEAFLILHSDVLEFLSRLLAAPDPVLQAWVAASPPSDWLITKGEALGHDLALSRNGHGAGFFDGDWDSPAFPTLGDSLQALARSLCERHLYVSDAETICILVSDQSMTHSVWIAWGKYDRQPPTRYDFTTEAELQAFLFGIDQADGWESWEQFDTEEEADKACGIDWKSNPAEPTFLTQSIDQPDTFWNNEYGWCDKSMATKFSYEERQALNLPIGGKWVVE